MSSEQRAEIRRLHHDEGHSIKSIVRTTGVSRNAVRRTLQPDRPAEYRRTKRRGSLTDAVEPQIRELLSSSPRMSATTIANYLGWTHSMTILRDRVRQLRPDFETESD